MFDTAFQGDPFNEQFDDYKLNIVHEGATFGNQFRKPNEKWLEAFNYFVPDSQRNEKYLCSGFIGASTELLIKALKLFNFKINT